MLRLDYQPLFREDQRPDPGEGRVEPRLCSIRSFCYDTQRAKKVVSDSPGLVDFAIGLVIFVLNLPNGQVLFFGEIQIVEGF